MTASRPGALTAIAIIAISLGTLGACGGVFGIGGLLIQGPLEESQRRMLEGSGVPTEQLEAQRAAQEHMTAVQREWMPFSLTHASLNVIASALLLVAGIMLFRTSRSAPTIFLAAVALNLLVDVGGGVLGILVQQDMQEAMAMMMTSAAPPGADPQFERMFEGIVRASAWTGVCFAVVWMLAKLGYYVWGVLYLRRPQVRALFGRA